MTDTTRIADLAEAYIALRAQRKALADQFKEADKPLKAMADQLEVAVLAILDGSGAQSMKTIHGTCYVSETTRYSVSDREALESYVKEHNALDIFASGVVKDVLVDIQEKEGALPPGVKTFTVRNARFRK